MKLTATEVRDWLETVATGFSLYLTWRWRPRRKGRDVTIKVPPATARARMSTPTVRVSHGDQAVLDSMAELFPYEFPPN